MGGVDKHTEETKLKISNAMKGNFNAEKWTSELVIDVLNSMWDFCCEEYEIEVKHSESSKEYMKATEVTTKIDRVKRKTHLKEKMLIVFGIKNAKWFAHMTTKFVENETVSNLLECIDMICRVNTYEDAANGVTNVAIAKMNLSHHHGWQDKQNFDHTSKGEKIGGISPIQWVDGKPEQ